MKTLITILFVTLTLTSTYAQKNNVETESVLIDDLITLIAEKFPSAKNNNVSKVRNVIFLIQTSKGNLSIEDNAILKQAIRFISKRLNEDDTISLIAYSGLNGIILNKTISTNLKKILASLNNIKSNITQQNNDGISLAYNYVNENFNNENLNTINLVRNPTIASKTISSITNVKKTPKSKDNVVLLTAISLLPELISILKN